MKLSIIEPEGELGPVLSLCDIIYVEGNVLLTVTVPTGSLQRVKRKLWPIRILRRNSRPSFIGLL